MSGYDVSGPLLLLGTIIGVGYALLGIGLVLAYRSSGFINFAHGSTGLVAASLMGVVVNGYGVPYWLGFVGALVVAALVSAAIEAFVVRKLSNAPKVLAMVATLGTGQALLLFALSFSSGGLGGASFPQPPWLPDFDLSVYVSPSATALLVLSPVLVGGLYVFLQRSRFGLAIRGAAHNRDAATLAGADPNYMAMLAWAVAGAVSAFSAVLILPNQSTVTPDALGPDFIIRGLAVAAIARFVHLPAALAAGVGLGIVEQVVATNPSATGYFEIVLFVVTVAGVVFTARSSRDEREVWATFAPDERLPAAYREVWLIRRLDLVVAGLVGAGALLYPLWASNRSSFIVTSVIAFALIAMSVTFLTGLAGQLSLGQVAFAAISAVVAVRVNEATSSLLAALAAAAVTGAVASAAVGLPALRVRGLQLAIATLAFALATSSWLLPRDWAFGSGLSTRPLELLGSEVDTARAYYYVALISFGVMLIVASLAKRSSLGMRLVAVRDNDAAAPVFRISPRRVTLGAYAISGAIAGVGGAVLAFNNSFVSRSVFTPSDSINAVAVAAIGGLTELAGPLLGAAYLIGIPGFYDLELSALAGLNAAWLILIVEQPRGLVGLLATTRRALIDRIARAAGVDVDTGIDVGPSAVDEGAAPQPAGAVQTAAPPANSDGPILRVEGLRRSFGAVTAVDAVSLTVDAGETLGLIGPNGAGKTTLFELISGHVRPDAGRVEFAGVDVTSRPPEARSRLGIVRSFQNAAMFPTMTPLQVIMLAEQSLRRGVVLHGSRRDRADERAALETLAGFGLDHLADTPLRLLSTGTRRLVELAANLALEPQLLLLDEPSAGVAQAETEALADLIVQMREATGVTIVVIEHDLPLLSRISDRMIAMEVGAVIANGTPAEVRDDPAVIASYLGTDPSAIARSGTL